MRNSECGIGCAMRNAEFGMRNWLRNAEFGMRNAELAKTLENAFGTKRPVMQERSECVSSFRGAKMYRA
ncbi:MAG TPA: hypothetical protein DHV31_00800 [Clostridiales bacterium]|nr:hypothetical protein [Clostridiales bacterium]